MRRAKNLNRRALLATALLLAWLAANSPVQGEELSSYQRELEDISERLNPLSRAAYSESEGGPKMTKAKRKEMESLLGRRLKIDPLWRLQGQLVDDLNAIAAVKIDDEKERARLMQFYLEAAMLVYGTERPSTLEAAERLAGRLRVALARRNLPLARREAAKKEGGRR